MKIKVICMIIALGITITLFFYMRDKINGTKSEP